MATIPNKSNTPDEGDEKYSLDEMMNRLKKGDQRQRSGASKSAPDGELITRDDGTQVVKVRKRKRRSKQPPKKQVSKTNPKLKWMVLGTMITIGIALVAGSVFIIAKYNGRKFKAVTETTITELSGAQQINLSQMQVTPLSAKATKVELTWDDHSFIKDATFNGIRAKIHGSSFFSSRWIGEEIVSSVGTVRLQTPSKQVEPTNTETIESPYQFGSYRCNELSLFFGDDRSAPVIQELQTSLRQLDNEQYQIVFHNGTMKVKNWPDMKLSSGIVTLTSRTARIEAQLKAKASHAGELTIKGTVERNTSSAATLQVSAQNYPIQELLGKNLGRFFQGPIQSTSGSFSYDYNKSPAKALSFILPFESSDIQLEGFPMFSGLNKFLGNTSYARPIFHRSRGTILRTPDGLTLDHLELINNRVLIMRGSITVNAKQELGGTLALSIPVTMFDGPAPQPFSGPTGGYYHLNVKLSGTTATPNDNFHQLIQTIPKTRKTSTDIKFKDLNPRGTPQTATPIPAQPVPPTPPVQQTPHQPQEKEFDDLTR